jgi:hypothetical protein
MMIQMGLDYNKVYEATRTEIAELERESAELDREIARKRQFLLSLGRMLGKDGPVRSKGKYQGQGLTPACALVLKAAYEPLSPTDVYERLKDAQFRFAKRASPVSTIGITLKRLADSGKALRQGSDRRPLYTWNWSSKTENIESGEGK